MADDSSATAVRDPVDFDSAKITVENIGGIGRCAITVDPGVTILEGRNATNRTSLLTAISDVLGGSPATLKSDAEAGRIELDLGDGRTYSRELARNNGGLAYSGEQYTAQPDLVDLFVGLFGDNAIRRAVERGDNLRDLLMQPVDTDQIEREIRELEKERSELDDRLAEIEQNRNRLPELEDRKGSLERERTELVEQIEAVNRTISEYDASESEAEQAEELLDELEGYRQELRSVEAQIANQDEQLTKLGEERAVLESELEEISVPASELDTVEQELADLTQRKRSVENSIDDIQRIIQFNENMIEGEIELPGTSGSADVTADLDPMAKQIECWTCGNEVERSAIAEKLEELRDIVTERRGTLADLRSEIEKLEDRRSELRRSVDRKQEIERQLASTDEEIDVRESKKESLLEEREQVESDIAGLEQHVDETEELRESELIEAYQRLSELEYERGQIDKQLEEVGNEIKRIEASEDEHEQLTTRRTQLSDEIVSMRSRIEDLEKSAVDQFNEHMETVLEVLEYQNIARVWIERKVSESDQESTFDLHVIRETTEGSLYEDTVATLSESEREVIGLVVALAGYLAHEVYETVPFMLLDSLEAIDSNRINALVRYFAEFSPFLIIALLPEDAATLPDDYDKITASALTA